MPPFTSVLPGMRVPDCLMKVARAPRVGALGLPSAVVGYLFELLGKGRHVLLLHLQLLPPGSRKQNIFGCEMPNAPLVRKCFCDVHEVQQSGKRHLTREVAAARQCCVLRRFRVVLVLLYMHLVRQEVRDIRLLFLLRCACAFSAL